MPQLQSQLVAALCHAIRSTKVRALKRRQLTEVTCIVNVNKDVEEPSAPADQGQPSTEQADEPEAGPSQPFTDPIDDLPPLYPSHKRRREPTPEPLRALSTLSWPPEADPKVYTDPLTRDDPKPLRRSELMAIGA